MYDSVTPGDLPADAELVAAYVDGDYANVAEVRFRCPRATIARITVTGRYGVPVCDCETGDLTPLAAVLWARTELDSGRLPTIYCNLATWPTVKRLAGVRGLTGRVNYWIADWGLGRPASLLPGAVAVQYASDPVSDLDTSIVAGHWPGVDPPLTKGFLLMLSDRQQEELYAWTKEIHAALQLRSGHMPQGSYSTGEQVNEILKRVAADEPKA
jgi:hypothetical protein